jgi:hypothetical protein
MANQFSLECLDKGFCTCGKCGKYIDEDSFPTLAFVDDKVQAVRHKKWLERQEIERIEKAEINKMADEILKRLRSKHGKLAS